jgi:dienelactone hydrolase
MGPMRNGGTAGFTTKECTMIAALVLATLVAAATPVPRPGAPVEEEVHQNRLVGEFAHPPDPGKHAGLIVLGGFDGGIPYEAFDFARGGYATLALAYFGASPLPSAIDRIPVETVTNAIDWMSGNPEVDASRIGIVGISSGSALALLAAALDPRIKSVAVVSPTAYVWFSPAFDGHDDRSSFTARNVQLAFIAPSTTAEDALGKVFQDGGPYAFRDLYDASLTAAPSSTLASATIPVERIGAPILCVAGDDDREWNSAASCATIAARRKTAQKDGRDQVTIEHGAGHALSVGLHPTPVSMPAGKMTIQLGGTPDANARAAADEWERVQSFLGRTL